MNIVNKENKPTQVLIPGGRWEEAVLQALDTANIVVEQASPKQLRLQVPKLQMELLINRAKEVPAALRKKDSTAVLGITGEDIIKEYNLASPDPFSPLDTENYEPLPLPYLFPDLPKSRLMWLLTPNAQDENGDFSGGWNEWTAGVIFSSYPLLAATYLRQRFDLNLPVYSDVSGENVATLPNARIEKVSGKVEAQFYSNPTNYLIADIVENGETSKANNLMELSPILSSIGVVMLTALEKATKLDIQRREDLIGILFDAVDKQV